MIEKYEKIVSSVAKLLEACGRVEEVERTNLLIQKQTDLLDLSNRDIICTPTQNKKGKSENETITSTERVRLKHLERTRRDAEREALEKIREHEDEIKLGHRLRRMERNVVETEEQFKIEKARWFPHHPTHSIISPTNTVSPRSAELSAPMMVSPMTEISSSSSVIYTPTTMEESMTTPPILSYRVQSPSSPFVPPSLISPSSMITPSSNLSTPSLMTSRVTCVDDLDENEMNNTSVVFSPLDRLMKISRNTAATVITPSNTIVEQENIQESEVEIEKENKICNTNPSLSPVVISSKSKKQMSPGDAIFRLRGLLDSVEDDEKQTTMSMKYDGDEVRTNSSSSRDVDLVKEKLNRVWKLIDVAASSSAVESSNFKHTL
jgi:hypothetical protein